MILCFSGGLDSLIAWYYLDKPPCVHFQYTSYSSAELVSVMNINPSCNIDNSLNLSHLQKGDNAYIPHRNMMFAALASAYSENVVMAGIADDVVEDKSPEAFKNMSKALTLTSRKRIVVSSPFWEMTKAEIVGWFLDNVEDARQLIKESTSCYTNERYCGRCPSCFRKACALWYNNIEYPFFNGEMLEYYYLKAISGKYHPNRNRSIISYYRRQMGWA